MKNKFSPARFAAVTLIIIMGIGWGSWQLLLARTGPAVHLLPSMIRNRLAAHGGTFLPLSGIPVMLREAVVATEDSSFWSNPGIDPKGIARSLVVDVSTGTFEEGGSTITQQLGVCVAMEQKTGIRIMAQPRKPFVSRFNGRKLPRATASGKTNV